MQSTRFASIRAAPPVRTWTGRRRPATLAKCVPSCLPNGRWNPGLPVDGQRPPRYRPGLLQQPSSTHLSSRETRQTLRKYMRFGVSGQLLNPVWPLNWQVEDARRKILHRFVVLDQQCPVKVPVVLYNRSSERQLRGFLSVFDFNSFLCFGYKHTLFEKTGAANAFGTNRLLAINSSMSTERMGPASRMRWRRFRVTSGCLSTRVLHRGWLRYSRRRNSNTG